MRLLLHICCAPCSIAPFKEIAKEEFSQITGFFYNPNIHPLAEYSNRRNAVEVFSNQIETEVLYPKYKIQDFYSAIGETIISPQRCKLCWRLRMRETATYAQSSGFDYFSTTLLISPYQDHESLRALGEAVSKESGVNFYYRDFRPFFRESQNVAKALALYRQRYCGCEYSRMGL